MLHCTCHLNLCLPACLPTGSSCLCSIMYLWPLWLPFYLPCPSSFAPLPCIFLTWLTWFVYSDVCVILLIFEMAALHVLLVCRRPLQHFAHIFLSSLHTPGRGLKAAPCHLPYSAGARRDLPAMPAPFSSLNLLGRHGVGSVAHCLAFQCRCLVSSLIIVIINPPKSTPEKVRRSMPLSPRRSS